MGYSYPDDAYLAKANWYSELIIEIAETNGYDDGRLYCVRRPSWLVLAAIWLNYVLIIPGMCK